MVTPIEEQKLRALARPVTTLNGVGPERASQLARLGIVTIEDLLLHRPRRHEDRRHFRPISELELAAATITRGTVVAVGVKWFRQHTKSICEVILEDGTARLHCRWWNLPYMEKYFSVGDQVIVSGKLILAKPRTIDHPETEVVEAGEENSVHLNRITPVYPLTEGLGQRWLRSLIWRTLAQFESCFDEPRSSFAPDKSEPPGSSQNAGAGAASHLIDPHLPTRAQAVRMLHFPDEMEAVEAGRRRLALDEFVELQQAMLRRRKNFEAKARALPCGGDNHFMKPFLAGLGFKLTGAQTQVLRQLRQDMSGAHPMRRLLQGDVGSGKTVVAACCGLMALESGYNVALMAPTELLAEQHFQNFATWFAPLGIGVELLTSSHKTDQREDQAKELGHLAAGPETTRVLFVGTHALLSEGVELAELGLVIIDEQHKFGVSQREQLVRKGRYPHLLVMTATPIPRTLGLTVYGELDLSTIDALPPGRGGIKTFIRPAGKLAKVWAFIREKLAQGQQAYVVFPRIEDVSQGVKALIAEFETLQREFAPFQVGLVHGRLKARERDEVMANFRANRLQVLLATSLVEVGVDVPNATMMVIEDADRFGLAQLHQLRGRIGRGTHESHCILVSAARNPEAQQRLKVLEETADGFRIAEADMDLRGPGELLGQEQSGMPKFRFGDLKRDMVLILQARQLASQLLRS